ncbi:MAG: hypothetical protein WCS03_00855 [Bacteroidota bacterium]
MKKRIIDAIPGIVLQLEQNEFADISAFLGFDACIDNIVRVVKDKNENDEHGFYINSRQFGEFLISKEHKSCGIELHTDLSKIGGNMVITGNALGNLGVRADCVGTFGLPEILPVFKSISANCTLHTVGETISATALEFNDSKFILFDPGPYNNLNWEGIKTILGIEKIKELFSGKQLISFLNWSEIQNSSQIWHGILEEIIPSINSSSRAKYFFTDFSDCSRKTKDEIKSAIDLLGRFRKYFKVIISLNQNEADLVAGAFEICGSDSDVEFVEMLFRVIKADILIIHRPKDAIAFDGVVFEKCDTFFCEEPKILTGGGDNFNAGFCYSLFLEFNLFQSLIVANAVSGAYVKTGISPGINNLIDFLQQNSKAID